MNVRVVTLVVEGGVPAEVRGEIFMAAAISLRWVRSRFRHDFALS